MASKQRKLDRLRKISDTIDSVSQDNQSTHESSQKTKDSEFSHTPSSTTKAKKVTVVTPSVTQANNAVKNVIEKNKSLTEELDQVKAELENEQSKQASLDSIMIRDFYLPHSKRHVKAIREFLHPEDTNVTILEYNVRMQDLLTESSLSDILPSIRERGQDNSGLCHLKNNGEKECISGSRRRKATQFANTAFDTWVIQEEIPVEDAKILSDEENDTRKDPSIVEIAYRFSHEIKDGVYRDWGAVESYWTSKSEDNHRKDIWRFKELVAMPIEIVKAYDSPEMFGPGYVDRIAAAYKKASEEQVNKLLKYCQTEIDAKKDGIPKSRKTIFDNMMAIIQAPKNKPAEPGPSTDILPVTVTEFVSKGKPIFTTTKYEDGSINIDVSANTSSTSTDKALELLKDIFKIDVIEDIEIQQ